MPSLSHSSSTRSRRTLCCLIEFGLLKSLHGGCALPFGLPTPLTGNLSISVGSSGSALLPSVFRSPADALYFAKGSSSEESKESESCEDPDEVVLCSRPDDRY